MSSSKPSITNNNNSCDDDVVIVAAVRTPLCRSNKGGLAHVPPSKLFQTVVQGLLQRVPTLSPTQIDDICVGNVLMPPSGFVAMRMAQLACGIPHTTSLQTVNRQCASSLQAIATIANAIRTNTIQIGIGAGVESMSFYSMRNVKPPPMANYAQLPNDSMDCLIPMGITSDTVAHQYQLSRDQLDDFAAQSHVKAASAQSKQKFQTEIVPVTVTNQVPQSEERQSPSQSSSNSTTLVEHDDGIRPTSTGEILAKLRPAFSPQGSTTAGNSSQTTDGAAGVILMKRSRAKQLQLPILATWVHYATIGVPPSIMGVGPAYAIPKVLQYVSLSPQDIDVYEINEAFASQALWCIETLGLNKANVNPNGGAIALGHPLGATGARLVVSLIYELQRRQKGTATAFNAPSYGVVSMCIGTGMGAAAVLKVEPRSAL